MFAQDAPPPPAIRWATPDIDQDGQVTVEDLLLFLPCWGECPDRCCPADIDRDGSVGPLDLAEVLRWWAVYDPRTYPWCR